MGGPIFNQPVEAVDDGIKLYAVSGTSTFERGAGVIGESKNDGKGVYGKAIGEGIGVYGESTDFAGVYGKTVENIGVLGEGGAVGVKGFSILSTGGGVIGEAHESGYGVRGSSKNGAGVIGESSSSFGVQGKSASKIGVIGSSDTGVGVQGASTRIGVRGLGSNRGNGVGIAGISNATGVIGWGGDFGGYFIGDVKITGSLTKGGGGFRIDHPLDPSNKYLSHSFVESADMKNVYDGVVVLDSSSEAVIELPGWFGALNKDFRYQLTAIGAPGPNLYISEEISYGVTDYSNNSNSRSDNSKSRFKIAGGTPGMKVSWQVTGIRDDPYAKAHPIQVEEDKPDKERGYYIHPDLYGQSEENGISRLLFPEEKSLEQLINDNKLT
jgi:hypothetical protein